MINRTFPVFLLLVALKCIIHNLLTCGVIGLNNAEILLRLHVLAVTDILEARYRWSHRTVQAICSV